MSRSFEDYDENDEERYFELEELYHGVWDTPYGYAELSPFLVPIRGMRARSLIRRDRKAQRRLIHCTRPEHAERFARNCILRANVLMTMRRAHARACESSSCALCEGRHPYGSLTPSRHATQNAQELWALGQFLGQLIHAIPASRRDDHPSEGMLLREIFDWMYPDPSSKQARCDLSELPEPPWTPEEFAEPLWLSITYTMP